MGDSHESCYYFRSIKGVTVNSVVDESLDGACQETSWSPQGAILVIEDCEPLLFFLNSALLNLGYSDQHLAANLAEADAVWALHKEEIRHVILNYELPDGLSLDFAARLLQDRPDLNVVITTGYDLAAIKESCASSNSLQFLQKPFRLAELKNALNPNQIAEAV